MFLCVLGIQRIRAGTRMGIDHAPGFVLGIHVPQHGHEHGMLEHIGMVAGMKCVAISEHRMLALA